MIAGAVAAVFMYHHVSATPAGGRWGNALTVTPQEFDDQLRYLRDRHCAVVSVDRLVLDVQRRRAAPCEVALTFDDGYADASTVVAPLLQRYHDTGTFFISTGLLGTTGHMTRASVAALAAQGMELGAHTVTHPDLTRLDGAALTAQVGGSRQALRSIGGQDVAAFAYPAGRYDARVQRAVRAAGFEDAFTTEPGDIDVLTLDRDMFALPRYRILRGSGNVLMSHVLGHADIVEEGLSGAALEAVARSRTEGNAPEIAERVAIALLRVGYPEQVLKVRVYATKPAVVAGVMLSGVKFHRPVDAQSFAADAADMVDRAFAADPSIAEVDIWAVVPISVTRGAVVSGDLAIPTTHTVFSASVLRREWNGEEGSLGTIYWEAGWLGQTTR